MAAVVTSCRVHPIVLFSIVDAFERRKEDAKRVIGNLLGKCIIEAVSFVAYAIMLAER